MKGNKTPRGNDSPQPADTDGPVAPTTHIFIGNPGSGKTTLVNCLSNGHANFESGLSFGGGLTQKCQVWRSDTGLCYIDTPGLADENLRKQAAKEIVEALRIERGKIKVIALNNARYLSF